MPSGSHRNTTIKQPPIGRQTIDYLDQATIDYRDHSHVRTSPYYPQSNGKKERWYKTLKGECIRVKTPLSLDDARRVVADFVGHYNQVRLHSAIGYVTPAAKLASRETAIFAERDRKLNSARERRRVAREAARAAV